MSEGADEKRMKLRYAGVCRVCDAGVPARVEAIYERSTKTVRCLACSPASGSPGFQPLVEEGAQRPSRPLSPLAEEGARAEPLVEEGALRPSRNQDPIDPGTLGSSARREHQRRHAKREARIRKKHPKLGGLILAATDDPAVHQGLGHRRHRRGATRPEGQRARLRHPPRTDDRRIPGTRANIDHIAVTPAGVYVIDPKRYEN